jgi:cytochrome d ubiquinol oxidase subunit II
MLGIIWFLLWGVLWAVYFMLDGSDLGLGTVMPVLPVHAADAHSLRPDPKGCHLCLPGQD